MMEYDNNLVSIITPVYNAEKFISKTIQSVINQTYKNWELILIDDCAKDDSANIIAGFTANDNRIKYYKLGQNSGAAVARNTGIQKALGRYLAFLDSDDLWLADKLEKQMDMMIKGSYSFVFSAIKIIDENGAIIKDVISVPQRVSYNMLLKRTVIATSSVLLDRCKIGNFTMPLRRSGQDYATWLMILRKISYAIGINDGLVLYRKSTTSLSSNKFKSIKQVYSIQTEDEQLNPLCASFNTFCFCLYAFKKHFLK